MYRRRLPYVRSTEHPVFLTWRLYGSLPPHRSFPEETLPGEAFAILDRMLEQVLEGPFWLRRAEVADMVVEALRYGERTLKYYALHAFVVMPNHVHLLVTPGVPVPRVTQSLKAFTAKRANAMLGTSGRPFWQEETYDHVVRDGREFERIRSYIEENPVRAGLVGEAGEYRWSSAGASGSSPAEHSSAPQKT